MSLKNTIDNQIKESMLNKSKERLVALRAIKSAILLEEKNGGSKKTEDIQILMRLIKQRKDSSQLYKEQNRIDLSEKEESEIKIIQEFLPKQINDEELDNEIEKIINDLSASSIKDMGRVMAILKEKYSGQMDFGKASLIVKEKLNS